MAKEEEEKKPDTDDAGAASGGEAKKPEKKKGLFGRKTSPKKDKKPETDAAAEDAGTDDAGAEAETEAEAKKDEKKKGFLGALGIVMPTMGAGTGTHTMGLTKKKPAPDVPSRLWKHIEDKLWDSVSSDLDGDDAAELASQWYKENLPLHAVLQTGKPSAEIILQVLTANPDAAKTRGSKNMLPLQLALHHKHGTYNVVRRLILAYPEALDARIDDKNKIRVETTRTWIDLQGHPADVKKLLQRSVADWKVIEEYEDEKEDQHDKLVRLEKRLKTAKKKFDKADKESKSVAERIGAVEVAYQKMSVGIEAEIEEEERILKERLAEIKEKLQVFMEMQEAKNKEILNEVATGIQRKVIISAVMEMKKDELVGLFQQSLVDAEQLKAKLPAPKPQAVK